MFATSRVLLPITVLVLGTYVRASPSRSSIDWKPCADVAQGECGSYQVPLDYAHPEVGNATLAVARIKASKKPRLGTLFTNPGGPGGSGVSFVLGETSELFINVTNGQYDIVSWDPRGVNQSTPLISCGFTVQDSLSHFLGNNGSGIIIEARGNFTDQDDLDALYAGLNGTDAKIEQLGLRCRDADGSFLKYMGTTAVVRDMVSLSDCLEGPGKQINYWGFSYGTVIGNYFVNMFPERVGRVIIDGVVDSITAATEPSYKAFFTELGSSEDVFAAFTQGCAQAGPQGCAFAKNDSTPASLAQDVKALINTTYDLHKAGSPIMSAWELRRDIYGELYAPQDWAAAAIVLNNFAETVTDQIAGNNTVGNNTTGNNTAENNTPASDPLLRMRPRVHTPRQNTNASNATQDLAALEFTSLVAITCVDSIDQDDVTTKTVLDEMVRLTHEVTPMFGELASGSGEFYCHHFPVRAVERFTGPFNHTLSYPIIVIGNQADPITPFTNAEKIANTLGSSAHLLKQNGLGHSSLAENSDCTHGVIRDYFLHGKLPPAGEVCEVNGNDLFPKNGTAASTESSARRAK